LGRLADFETLRKLADLYSIARSAIELRKSELRGIGWDVAPTAQAAKAMRGDHKAARDFQERRAKVVKFFRRPDPNYADFTSWFNAILEEFFVTDALSLYFHPSRVNGKGLLGSNLAALDLIDGAQVKPLLNVRGGMPAPPNPAFQIFDYSVPRVELMTLLADADEDGLLGQYGNDQLFYLPFTRRVWTPFGHSFLERALVPIMAGINKQQYQLDFFAEGTVPAVYVSPGDTAMTPSQLRELQDALNAIAGDIAWKHKIIVLPGGSKIDPQKGTTLADEFDTLVQIQTAMGFDIQPFELGILPQLSAAASASSGAARQAVTAHVELRQRKSTIPILLFLKLAIFDKVIQDICGMSDMELSWEGLQEEGTEDEVGQIVAEIGAGLLSIDEGRQMLGLEPWGLPITSDPGWSTSWAGFVPLTGVSGATSMPQGGAPAPGSSPGAAVPQAADFTGPSTASRPGGPSVPAKPRNQMSRGQRQGQARGVTATQNRTGSVGTPAHSGARAVEGKGPVAPLRAAAESSGRPTAASQTRATKVIQGMLVAEDEDELNALAAGAADLTQPTGYKGLDAAKAARELGLLRSHLRRGGQITAWQPRHVPVRLLGQVAENMAKGMSGDEACEVARITLGASVKAAEGFTRCGEGHRHWGEHGAAGLLIRAKSDGKWHYLLQRRGQTSDHAGTWGLPGGALHEGELPAMGAIREATEELGVLPNLRPGHVVTADHGGWAFHTVVCDAPEMFQPAVDGSTSHETSGWAWVTAMQAKDMPLHPLFAESFDQVRQAHGGKTITKTADGLGGVPVKGKWVLRAMRDNFPENALGWVKDADWVRAQVPMDRIDFQHLHTWAAAHQRKVERFAAAMEAGEDPGPVIMVSVPDAHTLRVVDGHHRVLAARKLGKPIEAYVGTVDSGDMRWEETHSFQKSAVGDQFAIHGGPASP
jgi:8-oxo-dGTP pyrophosphatase MutT (NUDIX family)